LEGKKNLEAQLEHERRAVRRHQEKQEIARKKGDTGLVEFFEDLERKAWKAITDLENLIRIEEVKEKRRRRK